MGSPRVLLSGSLSAASEHQLREALKVLKGLNPPSVERQESWRKIAYQALAFREMRWSDNVEVEKRRPHGRPPNKPVKDAAKLARSVLEMCGLERTTGLKGKWHLLTEIFADTHCDLRHHLRDLLAEKSDR